eukprot:TRINITY_DN34972_c0_g1_i1.p1 TRINITY_DN34972_c0_g1~~TRINITY_DN34972_c0_g1_i1.p1  ORF type:complete len:146 (+),score=23.41 TRINITY_DN34972_c0_g1_i1:65-439(+)
MPDMNRGRELHCCGSYDSAGKMVLIVVGGAASGGVKRDSTEKLLIGESRWSLVGSLPRIIYNFDSVTMNNKLYILGGVGSSGENLSDILEYDADLDIWEKVGDMQVARFGHAAAVIYADLDLCN